MHILNAETARAMEQLSRHGENDIKKAAAVIADVFSCTALFSLLSGTASEQRNQVEKKLITSFYNNLTLLVQKTWVEKSDETLKEQILFQLNGVCAALEKAEYAHVYENFMRLLHDTVYLLFGQQSKKEDFAEYAMRIDPDFGVFWQFLQNVPAKTPKHESAGRLYILLGMCFLANY